MAINHWPVAERPREKLITRGAAALSDAELLAILLRSGVHEKTALDLARELLARFGGLRALLDADRRTLCASAGLGPAKVAQLHGALELGQRYLRERLERGDALTRPDDTRRYLQARLGSYPHEVFACLFLDTRHRVIACEELFNGTIDGACVYPREVVRRTLAHNAAAVILAHNHPSGVAEPSEADRALTRRLQDALALVDVRVLDHLVIGDRSSVSFAERGLL